MQKNLGLNQLMKDRWQKSSDFYNLNIRKSNAIKYLENTQKLSFLQI